MKKKWDEYIEYFDLEKRGEHWIFWSWRKGEHIINFDHEYIESFSLLSADTVQRDLNSLGLKDSTYNVHLPPDSGGNFFLHFAKWIMQEVDWQGILGGPIRVQVSISLRNILEIDELRQVAKNDEIANFLSNVFFQMSAINLGCNAVPIM